MKKYKLTMILTTFVFFLILILSCIKNSMNDTYIKNVLNIIVLCLGVPFLIYVIVSCTYIVYSIKKDNKIAVEYIRDKHFDELEKKSKEDIKKYIFIRQILNSKYNLLISYFASGKNEKAFNLLKETKWRLYTKNTYVYQIFELLYKNNVDDARIIFKKLSKIRNIQDSNTEIAIFLFELIDRNYKNEKLSKTIYPIVNELCEKYEKK